MPLRICLKCAKQKKWKLEHEELDDSRKALFIAVINENAKLKKGIREFFEWLEAAHKTLEKAMTADYK